MPLAISGIQHEVANPTPQLASRLFKPIDKVWSELQLAGNARRLQCTDPSFALHWRLIEESLKKILSGSPQSLVSVRMSELYVALAPLIKSGFAFEGRVANELAPVAQPLPSFDA